MKLPRRITSPLYSWLLAHVVAARHPDFIVGDDHPHGAYLRRWYLTPWRRLQSRLRERAQAAPHWWNRAAARALAWLPNLYLHQFLRDDDDRALHDHPSWAISLILAGSYIEHTIAAGGIHHRHEYWPGTVRFLSTRHAHRIEIPRWYFGDQGPLPGECWTLFLFGPAVREWGFHCPERGWVHWQAFTAAGKPGEIGPGCDA
jgi:hypothetical protein